MASSEQLSEGHVLTRSVAFNFIGKIFPIIAGIVSIPILVDALGIEKFGALTIIWLIIGYFGILDFGLSKAIVYELGKELKMGELKNSDTVSSITTALFVFGVIFGVLVMSISPFIARLLPSIPDWLSREVEISFLIVGIGIPITIVGNAWRGVLETFQQFKKTAMIDSFLGGGTYAILAGAALFTDDLIVLTLCLLIIKILIGLCFYIYSKRVVKGKLFSLRINAEKVKSAFRFGKWIAISNTINPIMGHLDRYIIGALLTLSAVTFYTTPFDAVQKINLLPISMTAVLFPAFAITSGAAKKSGTILTNSVLATLFFVFPIACCVILFAEEILLLWLGNEFAIKSAFVLQILAIGAFFNSTSQIIFTYIQGIGKPKKTAQIHMFEFVFYTPLLWALISFFGIIGAACARSSRVFVDWFLLNIVVKKESKGKVYLVETLGLGVMLITMIYVSQILTLLYLKVVIAVLFLVVYFSIVWFKYMNEEIKILLLKKITGK